MFLVMKGMTLDDRLKEKDAWDINNYSNRLGRSSLPILKKPMIWKKGNESLVTPSNG